MDELLTCSSCLILSILISFFIQINQLLVQDMCGSQGCLISHIFGHGVNRSLVQMEKAVIVGLIIGILFVVIAIRKLGIDWYRIAFLLSFIIGFVFGIMLGSIGTL